MIEFGFLSVLSERYLSHWLSGTSLWFCGSEKNSNIMLGGFSASRHPQLATMWHFFCYCQQDIYHHRFFLQDVFQKPWCQHFRKLLGQIQHFEWTCVDCRSKTCALVFTMFCIITVILPPEISQQHRTRSRKLRIAIFEHKFSWAPAYSLKCG